MAITRHNIRRLIYKFVALTGGFQPYREIERQTIKREKLLFEGDVPQPSNLVSLEERFKCHYRQKYIIPRPLREVVNNLFYTAEGMGWVKNTLYERYSYKYPTTKQVIIKPFLNTATLSQGTVVQAKIPYSYGDWVTEHLASITQALPIAFPLLLPKELMERSYVRRDLALLGIDAVAVERPTLIRKATVLHKQMFFFNWTEREVIAYRQAFKIAPVRPRPGSIIYLSRGGETNERSNRSYPSQLTAEIMQELGATVVLARETTYDDYCALAAEAETVVADHGAAMFNLLLWNTTNVIELFSNQHWYNCFLFLTDALGISNYALINIDNIEHSELRRKLIYYLERYGVNLSRSLAGDRTS